MRLLRVKAPDLALTSQLLFVSDATIQAVVLVQNVSKLYRLYGRPSDRLRELVGFSGRKLHRDFWALRDVTLHVAPGEVLGIVGPNGSGKSTLLQVAAGILEPTSGRVALEGKVAAILELGAGFNPEFTGRENVFLSAEILGISAAEIARVFPDIASFADIGEFIDRPVKEYSSGMYVRLAFATAIHVDPDVLIVDEALAVGDAIFANRCLTKLHELRARKVTILFVSHDLGMITRMCDRAVLMLQGSIVCQGEPADVVKRYVGLVHDSAAVPTPDQPVTANYRHGDGTSRIELVELLDLSGNHVRVVRSGDAARIRVTARFQAASTEPMAGILVRNRIGIEVFGTNTRIEGKHLGRFQQGDVVTIDFLIHCDLARQDYTLTAAMQHGDGRSQDWIDDALQFTVTDDVDIAGLARLHTEVHVTTRQAV